MGFLNPLFLLAGGLILVPLFLHYFYRQESKTFHFPAIRYLLRTERDHARQIRTQQLLLLLLRIAIVLLLVLLGARMHFPGPGGAHEPTALALVIDNSMSATLIEDGERRLERLKEVARESARGAGHDDVIWVISAGTHWITATPGSGADALARIDETEASHGAGDLGAALERALALVGQSDLAAQEVHLFTDLQASGFPQSAVGDADIPVVVFGLDAAGAINRSVKSVTVGGGLPPLANRRSEAVVETTGAEDGDTIGVRLYIEGQVRAATQAPAGSTVRLPLGPLPPGRVEGFVEVDPDPL
ncbi:MAG: vWA domain-containing protein, partial [Longimicrobiales bacterium]